MQPVSKRWSSKPARKIGQSPEFGSQLCTERKASSSLPYLSRFYLTVNSHHPVQSRLPLMQRIGTTSLCSIAPYFTSLRPGQSKSFGSLGQELHRAWYPWICEAKFKKIIRRNSLTENQLAFKRQGVPQLRPVFVSLAPTIGLERSILAFTAISNNRRR